MVRRKTFAWLAGLVYSVDASVLGLKDIMLLKLTQMGTTNEGCPSSWLVRSGAGTRDFYHALAALVSPVQKNFSSPHAIQIYVAGSRAGPPVSECVSPVENEHRAGPTSPPFISGLTCEAQRVRFESRQ
jgi:hypothetical protein